MDDGDLVGSITEGGIVRTHGGNEIGDIGLELRRRTFSTVEWTECDI